jgi:hypothetical protein
MVKVLPFGGLKLISLAENPAAVQVPVAVDEDVFTKLGTLQGAGGGAGKGGPCETVMDVSGSMQSPGPPAGRVTWSMTILVSLPVGRNAPMNPASVQASRASATVIPRTLGTYWHVGVGLGVSSGSRVTVILDAKKYFGGTQPSVFAGSVTA